MAMIDVATEPWVPVDTFGARLALVRQTKGWNIAEAARACELSHTSWRNWEQGRSPHGMESVARKIADVTGCSYEWLMAGGELSRNRCFWQVPDSGQMHLLDQAPTGEWVGYNDRPQLAIAP